jgi:V8-like Glu-specific endopeptidase
MLHRKLTLSFSLLVVALGLTTTLPQATATRPRPAATVDAVGAIFTLTGAGTLGSHFCTGTVVHSPGGDLVLTAAHCLVGRKPGSLAFVPGYRNGRTPLGIWTIAEIFVDHAWTSSHDPDDDFAFLRVSQPGPTSTLQARTGAERLGLDPAAGQLTTVVGYPASTEQAITCKAELLEFSATQLEFDCDGYSNGTSGSALVIDPDPTTGLGTVIGAIGGYQQGGTTPATSYAAAFTAITETLYTHALQSA